MHVIFANPHDPLLLASWLPLLCHPRYASLALHSRLKFNSIIEDRCARLETEAETGNESNLIRNPVTWQRLGSKGLNITHTRNGRISGRGWVCKHWPVFYTLKKKNKRANKQTNRTKQDRGKTKTKRLRDCIRGNRCFYDKKY